MPASLPDKGLATGWPTALPGSAAPGVSSSPFLIFLVVWAFANTVLLTRDAFDPYPFIFLNLLLSMIAAIQAPIIMMSQNRQAMKDRFDASKDYEVNLKSEVELISLHNKIDTVLLREISELRADVARLQIQLAQYRDKDNL